MDNKKKIFVSFSKVDPEKKMVYGYVSTDAIDSQGEIVSKEAMRGAFKDYMKFANIREMHQASAVGVAKEYMHDNKGTWIGAKIVDRDAWEKVKEGVYKGFSIGGKILEKVGDVIKELKLVEISIVDRPANPEAVFEMVKMDDMGKLYNVNKEFTPSEKTKVVKFIKEFKDKTSMKKTDETPVEVPAETPAEIPAEVPAETPVETPAVETPAEVPAETPTEQPAEVPAETPVETPVEETPTETPVETPTTEVPADAPVETPVETPTETPVETPTEVPAEKADEPEPHEEKSGEIMSLANIYRNMSYLYSYMSDKGETGEVMDCLSVAMGKLKEAIACEANGETIEESEKATTIDDLSKFVGKQFTKFEQNVLAKVGEITKEVSTLKGEFEAFKKAPKAQRPVASYVLDKGEKVDDTNSLENLKKEEVAILEEINKVADEAKALMNSQDTSKQVAIEKRMAELRTRYSQIKVKIKNASL